MPPGVCTIRRKLPIPTPKSGSPPVKQRSANELSSGPSLRFIPPVLKRGGRSARRGRRIVIPTAADRRLGLASVRRLQQGEAIFPLGGGDLLSFRRQRRNP